MKQKFLILSFLLVSVCISMNAQVSSIVGEWKTVDDKTGEVKSVVQIYKGTDGLYYGKIIKLFNNPDAVCDECEGKNKGKPILGMVIVRGMKADGDILTEGYILDPGNGKEYYASLTYDSKTGKLKVRGSLDKRGWMGRNQYWIK